MHTNYDNPLNGIATVLLRVLLLTVERSASVSVRGVTKVEFN